MPDSKELREMTVGDLEARAADLRATLFQDQLKRRTGALDKPHERTGRKRDLARILAALSQKRAAAATSQEKKA